MSAVVGGRAGLRPGRRRWRAAASLLCVLLTLVGLAYVWKPRGVYWSRVDVQFLIPRSAETPNVLSTSSEALVMTAGAVERLVDPSGGKRRLADQSVTLASEGITHGWAVTVPNSGGQWSTSFATPQLQVEAVGPTRIDVTTRVKSLIGRIRQALNTFQRGVSVVNRITTFVALAGSPPVFYQGGRRSRALLGVLLVGVILTLLVRTLFTRVGRRPTDGALPDRPESVRLPLAFAERHP